MNLVDVAGHGRRFVWERGGGYTASCETLGSAAQTRLILT